MIAIRIDYLTDPEDVKRVNQLKQDILECATKIKSNSTKLQAYTLTNQEDVLKFYKDQYTFRDKGTIEFYFWEGTDTPNNGMQYYSLEGFWNYVSIEYFHRKLFNTVQLKYIVHSKTSPKTPKIYKPKELRGIKMIKSIRYANNRATCQIFLEDDDVWLKMTDYFSPTIHIEHLQGAPLSVRANYLGVKPTNQSFIYEDNWGAVVQRIQAWVKIENLYKCINIDAFTPDLKMEVVELIAEEEKISAYELYTSDIGRLIEEVINTIKEHKNTDKREDKKRR